MYRAMLWALALGAALVSGCATVSPAEPGAAATAATAITAAEATPSDPWENWNRKVFAFNEGLDAAVLKPVAEFYRDAVPSLARTGVDNFFNNFSDVWSAANHLLQGKVQIGLEMGMRVLTNTLFGLGGLLDPATEMKLERRPEDFGQTLGVWGVGNGPYLVLPVIGSSTVRDTVGFIAGRGVSYARLLDTNTAIFAVSSLDLISIRTNLLVTTAFIDQIALDKYGFVRDAYFSLRRNAQFDGTPPMDTFDDEPADAPPNEAPKPATPPPATTPQ